MNNFTMVQNEILSLNLSGQAFKLYCILKSYCFKDKTTCFPSQKLLADRLNRSVRTVQRALKELADCGLIYIKRRGSISNIYELSKSIKSSDSLDKNNNIHEKLNSLMDKNTSLKSNSEKYHHSPNTYNNYSNWKNKKDSFNDYEQRNYNFSKLEHMLLGYSPLPENLSELLEWPKLVL